MKKLPILLTVALSISIISACTKNDYNNGVDHTVGMAGTSRHWTGTASGRFDDTTISLWDTTVVHTAKPYSRTVDTSFAVLKYDTYAVTLWGTLLRYRETDSVAQTVKYDTLFSANGNTDKTILIYYYAKDSMTYDFHKVKEYNSYSGHHFEEHWMLKTKRS